MGPVKRRAEVISMTVPAFRRSVLSVLAFLPLLTLNAAAQSAAEDFERLMGAGFHDVGSAGSFGTGAPALAVPAAETGGVFLQSSFDGRLAYCSASGCRLLLNSGAGVTVLAGSEELYFTGPAGTGHCRASGCDLLLPGVRLTFPLAAGPRGDIYGTDASSAWHCTPDACAKAADVPLQKSNNYVQGVYKKNGDFVSSSADGTFWCADGRCARVGEGELLFIEDNCSGVAPKRAAYGFSGRGISRCTAKGCKVIGSGDGVDDYNDCAFDAEGGLVLNARDGAEGFHCSESGVVRTARRVGSYPAAVRPARVSRTSDASMKGADGATYSLVDHNTDRGPAAGAAARMAGAVERTDRRGRVTALAFDTQMACWNWQVSGDDDDEDASAWFNGCRLMR